MNVVLYSARNIFCLIISNFVFGLLTSSVPLFIEEAQRFMIALTDKRFLRMREYLFVGVKSRFSAVMSDMIVCILAACFMLVSSFVFNSGEFRIISIIIFVIGFLFGKVTVCRLLYRIISRIFFSLKWMSDVALYPFLMLVSFISKHLINNIKKLHKKYRTKILTKHTEYCFSRINVDARYGLLDDYYKELKNERTV